MFGLMQELLSGLISWVMQGLILEQLRLMLVLMPGLFSRIKATIAVMINDRIGDRIIDWIKFND